jgi:hypothetical protein
MWNNTSDKCVCHPLRQQPIFRRARVTHRLTATTAKALRSPGKYLDGHGLSLHVITAERRVWVFRHQRRGRDRSMSLGNSDVVTLAQAHEPHTKIHRLFGTIRLAGVPEPAGRQAPRSQLTVAT